MERPVSPARNRHAILRQAIIRAIPTYFAWSEAEQEQYRLTVSKAQDFLIRQVVLRALFGIEVDTEETMNEALVEFDDARYLLLNSTLSPFQGLGDNDFFRMIVAS